MNIKKQMYQSFSRIVYTLMDNQKGPNPLGIVKDWQLDQCFIRSAYPKEEKNNKVKVRFSMKREKDERKKKRESTDLSWIYGTG